MVFSQLIARKIVHNRMIQNEAEMKVRDEEQLYFDSNIENKEDICRRLLEEGYKRIDSDLISKFSPEMLDQNAIHGTLNKKFGIACYEVYQKGDETELACIVHIGEKLCGHPGIVHGGILSAIFDNTFGWLFFTMKEKPAFTANLNVNFRNPVYANTSAIVRCKVAQSQDRKIFMNGSLEWEDVIFADASALFIRPRPKVIAEEKSE